MVLVCTVCSLYSVDSKIQSVDGSVVVVVRTVARRTVKNKKQVCWRFLIRTYVFNNNHNMNDCIP